MTLHSTLNRGLVAHWTMDKSTIKNGTVYDSSAHNNHGVVKNSSDLTTGEPSVIGESLYFGGSSGYIEIPHKQATNITGNSLTIAYWEKWEDAGDKDHPVIAKNPDTGWSPDAGYVLGHGWSSTMYGGTANTGGRRGFSVTESDGWTHVVLTYDGSTLRYYKDGQQVDSASSTAGIGSTTEPVYIGNANRGGRYKGYLSNILLYERTLSADEIKQLAQMRSHRVARV